MKSATAGLHMSGAPTVCPCAPGWRGQASGGWEAPRVQKMLKGHLPRVINHRKHFGIHRKTLDDGPSRRQCEAQTRCGFL